MILHRVTLSYERVNKKLFLHNILGPAQNGHPVLSEYYSEGPKGVRVIQVSLYLPSKLDIGG